MKSLEVKDETVHNQFSTNIFLFMGTKLQWLRISQKIRIDEGEKSLIPLSYSLVEYHEVDFSNESMDDIAFFSYQAF